MLIKRPGSASASCIARSTQRSAILISAACEGSFMLSVACPPERVRVACTASPASLLQ